MKASGVMAASLFFYLVYSLAGPEWMLAPALGFVGIVGMRARGRGVPLRRTRRIVARSPDPPLVARRMTAGFTGQGS
jgi:hypothetical protein